MSHNEYEREKVREMENKKARENIRACVEQHAVLVLLFHLM